MTGRPNPQTYQNQLLQQYQQQNQMLMAQQQAYSAQIASQQQATAQRVSQQTASATNAVKKATRKPVTLGTILTSPTGILGNPILSGSMLSG